MKSMESVIEHKVDQIEQLTQISILSESLRKKFSERLRSNAGEFEELQNRNFNHVLREELFDHSLSYMQEQFKMLFESIENISTDRKQGELLNLEIFKLKTQRDKLQEDIIEKNTFITNL